MMAASIRVISFLNKTSVLNLSRQQYIHIRNATGFKAADLTIEKSKILKEKPGNDGLVFGANFSDHMLSIQWSKKNGWGKPKIHPLENLSIHPCAKVFHYAPELFEGMKGYRGVDNKIRLFRPMENMRRMNSSARRATLPEFDGEELVKCMKKLIHLDREWVPYSQKNSLYIRPTMIGTEPTLGVGPSQDALLFVVIGPVGPYYPTGLKPVSLLADPSFVRAWPGGSGFTKMGANYAPTIFVQKESEKHGCQQVLWLYGDDHQLTEVGTMNIFMYWTNEAGEEELLTPPLTDGTILPGVTRRSIIDLGTSWNEFKVREKKFTMADILKGLKEGRVKELFGAGTACVVSPIERILYKGENLSIPTMEKGAPLAMRFLKELTDIQYGRTAPHDWTEVVEE